jgi:fluoroacetyl-CoA thioesterase
MARLSFTVSAGDTAVAMGSGDVEVLATPRLVAWVEAATVAEAARLLGPGQTSVGSRVAIEHLLPSAVGALVMVEAELTRQDEQVLRFTVAAVDGAGALVASATVNRVVVDRQRFLDRLSADAGQN